MPASTLAEIVSEGLLQAADTSLTNRAIFSFKKWLRSQAIAFLWPQCKVESVVAFGGALSILQIGGGLGGITNEIQRINDPLKIYAASSPTLADFANVRIQTDWDNALVNNTQGTGKPENAIVRQVFGTKGAWNITFNRTSDKAYTVLMSSYQIPEIATVNSIPWYPNDRTMVQSVYVEALKYKKDSNYMEQLDLLAHMVQQDKVSEGIKPGVNDGGIQLNSKYFK